MSSRRAQQQREVVGSGFIIGLMLVALWVFTGCASGPPRLTPGACDPVEVGRFTAHCKAQVALACNPDPSVPCEAERLCDERLCDACPKDAECLQ
jgi:hypothetical protein